MHYTSVDSNFFIAIQCNLQSMHYALYIRWLQLFHCDTKHYVLYIRWLQLFHHNTMHYVLYISWLQHFHCNTMHSTINALWIIRSLTQPFLGQSLCIKHLMTQSFSFNAFYINWIHPLPQATRPGSFLILLEKKMSFLVEIEEKKYLETGTDGKSMDWRFLGFTITKTKQVDILLQPLFPLLDVLASDTSLLD